MATIEKYSTKAGLRYRVRYRMPDHRQTDKRGFKTKRDAEAFANTVEVEKMSGTYVAPKLGLITVGELAPEWLARKESDLKPSAYRPLETAWDKHVQPRWGNKRIADIDLDQVERWIADMGRTITEPDGTVSKKGSGATVVLRAYGVLAGILDSAVKARRLAANPARTPENLPRKKRKPRTYLTHEQVGQLADEAGQRRVLVLLLAYTGIRWGEAIGLRVKHLDLPRKRLTVTENAVQVGQKVHVGTPKSHESRSVPIPEFVVFELAAQCAGKGRDDLVFDNGSGGHLLRPTGHTTWFAMALKRSGVPRVTDPRFAAHSGVSGRLSGREREGSATDARTCLRGNDIGYLRGPVRRRSRCCGRRAQ